MRTVKLYIYYIAIIDVYFRILSYGLTKYANFKALLNVGSINKNTIHYLKIKTIVF